MQVSSCRALFNLSRRLIADINPSMLEAATPALTGRLQPLGMGFRENLIGTGTDDLRDALDRRVEFRVRSCS